MSNEGPTLSLGRVRKPSDGGRPSHNAFIAAVAGELAATTLVRLRPRQ